MAVAFELYFVAAIVAFIFIHDCAILKHLQLFNKPVDYCSNILPSCEIRLRYSHAYLVYST